MKRSISSRRTRNWGVFQPFARAIIVVAAVAVLATGVTYAALQSQTATLTGNSISTATADLRISNTSGTSSTSFAATKTGFNFANIIPGAAPIPAEGYTIFLKNFGNVAMNIRLTTAGTVTNTSNLDLSKVYLIINRIDSGSTQRVSLASLTATGSTNGVQLVDMVNGTTAAQYKLQVVMDEDAFTGSSATLGGVDLVFSGSISAPVTAN